MGTNGDVPSISTDLDISSSFRARAEALIARLGENDPDVQVFRAILAAGHIDTAATDALTALVPQAKDDDAAQLAIDLGLEYATTVGLVALFAVSLNAHQEDSHPMMVTSIDELKDKQIVRVEVYRDIALFAFSDGSMMDVRTVEGELRVEVRKRPVEGGPHSCSVYRSDFPY